ncbi:cellulose synthase operon protein YhjQ/BcsQ [Proteus columbae]|uniref:cellulose synthase operon protein YhjQ/BcsQ n=1 Tax=Proteus columbae TaxID=1987580 RepID=UPI0018C639A9|nr:cellulose synthase operon protein YhjQ/BcsQ [Proteus columbae]MBG6027787.1 AAA family ATPase [Proteus mirabilis]MBG6048175.1 AAA family ATPase [Proteus mirabilis]
MPLIVLKGLRGGVGTTSTAIALARQFNQQNKEVLIIDNCTENILSFYFPAQQKSTTLSQALLAETPIEESIFYYRPHYQVLPFGLVNMKDNLLLQLSFSAKQHLTHFLTTFIQLHPDVIILMDLQHTQDTLFTPWIEKADVFFTVSMAESNCHIRLNQHTFIENEYVLINQFRATSQIHQDFYQFWQTTPFPLCPVVLHRDEASLEACASRLPLYDYRANCMLVEEISQLAQWCFSLFERKEGQP